VFGMGGIVTLPGNSIKLFTGQYTSLDFHAPPLT
jgi:hypothetical protein